MKIVTYIAIGLLVIVVSASASFYIMVFKPMSIENGTMKVLMPEFEKVKTDLAKIKQKEAAERAWLAPAIEALTAGLSDEISSGKAEVLPAGDRVIVNITESALYVTDSHTFSQDSTQLRLKLVTLMRKPEFKGKLLYIGNTTEGITAQGRGKTKTIPKDARVLAAERSGALIKDFEKNQVDQDALVAVAFSSKLPDIGIKLKNHKTMIVIENPPIITAVVTKQPTKPAATGSAGTGTSTVQSVITTSPVQPSAPKGN